jgi:digeranylgeranylglycerophospholipid reductase
MAHKYDAVIVGASIAGLSLAHRLARSGWKVCVLDRRRRIGEPVRCGEATGSRAELARFVAIDEQWIARDIEGLTVHLPGGHKVSRAIPGCGVILHRARFEQSLARACADSGAEVILSSPVIELLENGGRWHGVKAECGRKYAARFIIGADGCESTIGRLAGISRHLRPSEAYPSAQYIVQTNATADGHLHFHVGREVIPGGYLWVFPRSSGSAAIGAGMYGVPPAGTPGVLHHLDRFLQNHYPDAAKSDLITGCVPLARCPKKLSRGNVLVIGDAARQANPLTAGGIMNALEAADSAAKSLLRHQTAPSRSQAALKRYSRTMHKLRREQTLFSIAKDLFLAMDDRRLCREVLRADRLLPHHVDRSTPFCLPWLAIARLLLPYAPMVLKGVGSRQVR